MAGSLLVKVRLTHPGEVPRGKFIGKLLCHQFSEACSENQKSYLKILRWKQEVLWIFRKRLACWEFFSLYPLISTFSCPVHLGKLRLIFTERSLVPYRML